MFKKIVNLVKCIGKVLCLCIFKMLWGPLRTAHKQFIKRNRKWKMENFTLAAATGAGEDGVSASDSLRAADADKNGPKCRWVAYLLLRNVSFYWSRNEQMEHTTHTSTNKPTHTHTHTCIWAVDSKKFCIIYERSANGGNTRKDLSHTHTSTHSLSLSRCPFHSLSS